MDRSDHHLICLRAGNLQANQQYACSFAWHLKIT